MKLKPAQFYQGGSLYLQDNNKVSLLSINEINRIKQESQKRFVDEVLSKR